MTTKGFPTQHTLTPTKHFQSTTTMPRKWRVDGDEDRLPEGVSRTGYDADTQTYTYSGVNGEEYAGQPAQQYGELTLTRAASSAGPSQPSRRLTQVFLQPEAPSSRTTAEPRVPSRSRTLAEPRQRLSVADRSSSHGERTAKKTHSSTRSSSRIPTTTTTPASARPSRRSHNPDRNQTFDAVMTPATTTPDTTTSTASLAETTRLSPNPNRNQTFSAIMAPEAPTPTTASTTYPRRMSSAPARREAAAPQPKKHRRRHSQPVPPRAGVAREFCREAGGFLREVTVSVMQKMTRGLKKRKEALRVEREAREERERREDEEAGWV